ncbi:MAG: phosphoheptose isomerase [Streptosporangiaceae bacterium]|nr:phosphoheptose isomerase [Streptosporangiaceae bacterium]
MTEPDAISGAVCVTCADEALPGTVVRMLGRDLAVVETGGRQERVSVALVDAMVGDTVLVHAKEALVVVDRAVDEDGPGSDAAFPDTVPMDVVVTGEIPERITRQVAERLTETAALRRELMDVSAERLTRCAEAMAQRFAEGGRLFTFGNGTSSTDAQELAALFSCSPRGRALPALCLAGDVAVVTALSDEAGFEAVFSTQIAAYGRPGDIAIALSTSGGSANVVRALEEAERASMLTIALAGCEGGRLAGLGFLDHLFVIPSRSVPRIHEAQTTLCHLLWELTEHAVAAVLPPVEAPTVR